MKRLVLLLSFILASILHAQNTCVNSSFENGDFSNWAGSKGHTGTCGDSTTKHPVYTPTLTGIFSTYLNANIKDPNAYHTILDNTGNIASTSGVYYYSVPYDTFAVNSSSVYEIPFVCPFFSDNYSARLNNIASPYNAARITYTVTNVCDKKLNYAFALVFNDGGHALGTNPFFMVRIFDQNMNVLDSLVITIQPGDTSFKYSSLSPSNPIMYRKWEKKQFDFTLPVYSYVTTAYLEFTVGFCCFGAHFGYAYIDAECSTTASTNCSLGINILDMSNSSLNVYPMPATDVIYVNSDEFFTDYQIINLYGQTIISGKIDNDLKEIRLPRLSNGMYILVVDKKGERQYQKFIIQN